MFVPLFSLLWTSFLIFLSVIDGGCGSGDLLSGGGGGDGPEKTRETRLELLFPSTLSKLLRRRYARASLLYFEPRNALIPPLTRSMTDSGSDWTGSVDHTRLPLAIAITKASFRFDSDRERVLLRRSQ